MPPLLRTRALVMRSVDYGESDRILTLLTERHGKVAVIARGARASRRRFGGSLEPFCIVSVEITLGRGTAMGRLSTSSIDRAFVNLVSDLDRMREAGAAISTIRALIPERHPEPELFDAIEMCLEALDGLGPGVARQLKTGLVARSLSLLGFAPHLDACGECGRRPTGAHAVQLDPVRGHVVCRACGGASLPLSARSRALLTALLGGGWLEAARSPWPDAQLGQVGRTITRLLENCLEREVTPM